MLKKLREQRTALLARCKEIEDAAAAREEGQQNMTEEERTEVKGNLVKIRALNDQIQELEDLVAEQKAEDERIAQEDASRAVVAPAAPSIGATTHDRREDEPWDADGGSSPFGQFLMSVRGAAEDRQTMDPRLRRHDISNLQVRAAAGMNETVASEGGFLVTAEESATLLKNTFDTSLVWPRATDFPLGGTNASLKLPYVDETSRVDGSRFGGVRAYWVDEAEAPTATKPKIGKLELGLKKLAALCYLTDELLTDATALETFVRMAFSEEMAFKLDDAAINGSGAGLPLGIMNAPCIVSVSKETSQAADTILYENVNKMESRMLSRAKRDAVWFINADVKPQLRTLVVPVKNVAGSENVGGTAAYLPANGAAGRPFDTLLNYPVVEIEQAATIGDTGDIILANMGYYVTISKGGLQSASSIHVKFTTDETAFRFILRVDGQPWLQSAVTPFKGSNTQSAFVKLNARA